MKKYRTLATLLGIGLNVVSGIFTVKLMWTFATSGMGKIIMAAFGVLMQATMAACAVFAVHCAFQNQAGRAVPAAVVYSGLLLLSFCGTAGNLSTENARLNQSGAADSPEFRTLSGQIADIDTQAEYLRKEIDECRTKNIITRCVRPKSEELTSLLNEKRDLQNRLMALRPAIAEDEIFRRLSEFLQISTDQTKSLVLLIYSILLDLSGAVLLVYGAGLLAFQTRDLWKEAELRTELERQRFAREREKVLSSARERQIPDMRKTAAIPAPEYPKLTPPLKTAQGTAKNSPAGTDSGKNQDGLKSEPSPSFRNLAGNILPGVSGFHSTVEPPPGSQTGPDSEPGDDLPEGSEPDTVRYVRAAFAGRDQRGFLLGRSRIGEQCGLSVDECNRIHLKLKKAGLVDVRNQKTYPKYSEEETVNLINGDAA